ncbi:hypothetical protein KI387_022115, partial [Taxus chinensis]
GVPKGVGLNDVKNEFGVPKGAQGKRLQQTKEVRHEGATVHYVTGGEYAPLARL